MVGILVVRGRELARIGANKPRVVYLLQVYRAAERHSSIRS
jgi:hypothetical protein